MNLARGQAGFTMLEMLLSVTLLAAITALSLPVMRGLMLRNDLDITAVSVVQAMRRAQEHARSGNADSPWGVHLQNGTITVFQGATYAGRTATADETTTVPANVTVGGLAEVVYSKRTAFPSGTGTATLTSINGDTRSITLNAKGMVAY